MRMRLAVAGTAVGLLAAIFAPSFVAEDLEDTGGFKLSDQTITVSDVPLTTVTVFRGDTNARARTFSYWLGIDEYAQIAQVIDDFYNTYIGGSI